jgi:hypothetical protein
MINHPFNIYIMEDFPLRIGISGGNETSHLKGGAFMQILHINLMFFQTIKEFSNEKENNMNNQINSQLSNPNRNNRIRSVILITILLLLLAFVGFLVSITRVVSISGKGSSYILKANQIRMGILYIENDATAIFNENSHWIGPIISKKGALIVQNDVTVTGPVVLFSNGLVLGENDTVDGNIVLFSGSLRLQPGAAVRHNVVLFAGSAILEQGTYIRGNIVSFAGSVVLKEKANLRGDAVLFAGSMNIGYEAVAYGKAILFAGGLNLAPKSILHKDAVLFFGDAHLSQEAQVRGDVILTAGNATLDSRSRISGKLYLSPDSYKGWGRFSSVPDAQILGGVSRPENIEKIAGWSLAEGVLWNVAVLLVLPVVAVGLLMALMFYAGLQTRSSKERARKALVPESNAQPMVPGSVQSL